MNEKIERMRERYNEIIIDELAKGQNPTIIPKQLMIDKIETVFVTLKSNKDMKKIYEMFVRENNASRLIRKLCCVEDEVLDHVEFEDQALQIEGTIEPDQINWMNYQISLNNRRYRLVFQIFLIFFVAFGSLNITIAI